MAHMDFFCLLKQIASCPLLFHDHTLVPTPSPLRAYSHITACPAVSSPLSLPTCSAHLLEAVEVMAGLIKISDFYTKVCPPH